MGIDRSSSGSGEIIRPETGAYATEIGGLSDIPQKVQNDFDLWILVFVPGSDFYRLRVINSSLGNLTETNQWSRTRVSMVQFAQ